MRFRGKKGLGSASRGPLIIVLITFNILASVALLAVSHSNNAPTYTQQTLSLGQQDPSNNSMREFSIPTPNSGPEAIISAPNGTFWFTEFAAGKIAELFPVNNSVHEFPIPETGAHPAALAVDKHGKIWFADESSPGTVWMFDPSTATFASHKTRTVNSTPLFILVDNQNNIWFTELTGNNLGELSYPSYAMTEFPLPTPNSGPAELASQNNTSVIWMTETYANQIAKFDMTSHSFQEFRPSVSLKSPVGIVLDNSGSVWFSEHGGSSIVELNPSNSVFKKYVTSVPPSSALYPYSAPATLAIDKTGKLWFVEHYSNKVGRLDPNSSSIDEFAIPNPNAYSVLNALDPNGNFWFTQFYANMIGEALSNASSPISVSSEAPVKPSITAGQTTTANVFVANKLQSLIHVNLNFSSSFSASGQTSTSQVSLSSSTLNLGPGQNASITASITPNSTLTTDLYSIGITATYANTSSVGIIFIQVQGNSSFFNTLAPYLPELGLAVIIVLGVFYMTYVRRRLRRSGSTSVVGSLSLLASISLIISAGILLLSLYSELNPSITVVAKCPGLPPIGPAGGPNYLGIALDVAFFAVPAYFLYVIIKDMLRTRKRKTEKGS